MNSLNPRNEYLTDLIEKYSDLLLRIAFTYLKNLPDAEDIVHDAFVKLMQKNPVFISEEHEKVSTFMKAKTGILPLK